MIYMETEDPAEPTQRWSGLPLPNFKTYSKATAIKTGAKEQTDRSMEQNRNPKNTPT